MCSIRPGADPRRLDPHHARHHLLGRVAAAQHRHVLEPVEQRHHEAVAERGGRHPLQRGRQRGRLGGDEADVHRPGQLGRRRDAARGSRRGWRCARSARRPATPRPCARRRRTPPAPRPARAARRAGRQPRRARPPPPTTPPSPLLSASPCVGPATTLLARYLRAQTRAGEPCPGRVAGAYRRRHERGSRRDGRVGGRAAGADRQRPAAAGEAAGAEPGAGRGARRGRGVRGVPHRPAPRRGRPAAAAAADRARPRGRWAGSIAARAGGERRSAGGRPGRAWRGCAAPAAPAGTAGAGAENLCPSSRLHRVGRRRRLRRATWSRPPTTSTRCRTDQDPQRLAPLLCAGIIGYRALLRAELPPGGRLGIYGFGASAHLTAQVAIAQGATVHVLTRSTEAQRLALELGAASAGGADDAPPEPLDSAILFAPVGDLVPVRAGGARPGRHARDRRHPPHRRPGARLRSGTCSRSGSCAASPRTPGPTAQEFLAFAAGAPVCTWRPSRTRSTEADRALADLAADRVNGAAVLVMS